MSPSTTVSQVAGIYHLTFTSFKIYRNGNVFILSLSRVVCAVLQEQYIFVYDALLEALKAGKTVIGCSNFKPEFDKLCVVDESSGKSTLQQQYEVSHVAV